MADTNMNKTQDKNQTMQHEQAKASVAGSDRKPEQGGFDQNRDKDREKSAIGGSADDRSKTGEPGRARSELDQGRDSDKSRESSMSGSNTSR